MKYISIIMLCFSIAYFSYSIYGVEDLREKDLAKMYLPEISKNIALDVGAIKQISIEIENKGIEDLIISNLSTSCGCLVPALEQIIIPTASKMHLPLVFNDVNGVGVRSYEVVGNSNDPNNPYFSYKLQVTVSEDIAFNRLAGGKFAFKSNSNKHEDRIKSAQITIDKLKNWTDLSVSNTSGEVECEILASVEAPGGFFTVILECKFHLDESQKVITKNLPYTLYKESQIFETSRSFGTGIFINGEFNENIVIKGVIPSEHQAEYVGSALFIGQADIIEKNQVAVKLRTLQKQSTTTEKGHVFIKDKTSGKIVFSYPLYIKY